MALSLQRPDDSDEDMLWDEHVHEWPSSTSGVRSASCEEFGEAFRFCMVHALHGACDPMSGHRQAVAEAWDA